MIVIEVDEEFKGRVEEDVLKAAASKTLNECLDEEVSLTIVIMGDEKIRAFNEQHRGVDKATDVLSFTADYLDPDLGHRYLGDVLISLPTAESQAKERKQPVRDELQLLVIHGVLHLLGYDHLDEAEEKEMWTLQDRILELLGLDMEVEGW
ncbi:MAG: rRNA maturation RNase YbeY [Anaerolineales bacterium]|nr:rRNA maturation RNase YbeY [Anaerolineales bacterium]MBS3753860.1 rRNA maturation RNase YbeY [Anaerolineales bacterium]